MKKSLIITLALVFALSIAGTALANPFNDVPANHWAYASVSKLAKAGIIDGYGDGRFIGNSNMTRYEMAQIVAKAMANSDKADAATKAQIEKLAAEFSAELNKLGLKVASLEKKTDNVKITGEAHFTVHSWSDAKIGDRVSGYANTNYSLRTRLWLTGNVNDNWQYTAMLENIQDFRTNNQETQTNFKRAYVQGKIGMLNVTAGRVNYLSQYGTVLNDDADGLVLGYNKGKFNMDVFALRANSSNSWYGDGEDFLQKSLQSYGTQIGYSFTDKLHTALTYYDLKGKGADTNFGNQYGKINTSILELGLDYKFDDNWFAWANYLRGGKGPEKWLAIIATANVYPGSRDGWAAGVSYGTLDRNKPGSYQLRLSYYDIPYAGYIATQSIEPLYALGSSVGFTGYVVGGSYTLAKNIDLTVDYYDYKSRVTFDGEKEKQNFLFSLLRFYF